MHNLSSVTSPCDGPCLRPLSMPVQSPVSGAAERVHVIEWECASEWSFPCTQLSVLEPRWHVPPSLQLSHFSPPFKSILPHFPIGENYSCFYLINVNQKEESNSWVAFFFFSPKRFTFALKCYGVNKAGSDIFVDLCLWQLGYSYEPLPQINQCTASQEGDYYFCLSSVVFLI